MEINGIFWLSCYKHAPLKFSSRLPIIFLISTKNHPFSIVNAIAKPLIFLCFSHFPLSQFYPFSPQNQSKNLVTQGFSRYTPIDSPVSITQSFKNPCHINIFTHFTHPFTITNFSPHDKQKKSRSSPTLL